MIVFNSQHSIVGLHRRVVVLRLSVGIGCGSLPAVVRRMAAVSTTNSANTDFCQSPQAHEALTAALAIDTKIYFSNIQYSLILVINIASFTNIKSIFKTITCVYKSHSKRLAMGEYLQGHLRSLQLLLLHVLQTFGIMIIPIQFIMHCFKFCKLF